MPNQSLRGVSTGQSRELSQPREEPHSRRHASGEDVVVKLCKGGGRLTLDPFYLQ